MNEISIGRIKRKIGRGSFKWNERPMVSVRFPDHLLAEAATMEAATMEAATMEAATMEAATMEAATMEAATSTARAW
jgi:hypothetical protein